MLPILSNATSLNPTRTAGGSFNRLASLFDRFFNEDGLPSLASVAALPLAMWQDEDHVFVEMDVPGLTEQDIELTVHGGELIIQGERKSERQEGVYDCRRYGRFEQRLTLPAEATSEGVEAKLVRGVLNVTIPKRPESKPRKITLKAE